MKNTGGQVEDGAEAGLQSSGTTSVDHDHLVDLFWILVGQERTERHTGEKEQKAGYRIDRETVGNHTVYSVAESKKSGILIQLISKYTVDHILILRKKSNYCCWNWKLELQINMISLSGNVINYSMQCLMA